MVSIKSSPWPKYTQYGTIFPKKSCSTVKLFFFFKYVIYWTVLSKYLEKKSGVTGLVSSQTTVKCGHGFGDHSHDGELARWGLRRDTKWRSCYAQKRLRNAKPGNHLNTRCPTRDFRRKSQVGIQGHSGPAYANWLESFVERGR